MNQILLNCRDAAAPYWGTFMQWKNAGFPVRKGEKASQVIFFTVLEKEEMSLDSEDFGTTKNKKFPFMRYYSIFHAGQVDDPDEKFKDIIETKIETDYETANKIIEHSHVEIRIGGNSAFYSNNEKYIVIPLSRQFVSEEEHIATIFHELAHWADRNILGTPPSMEKNDTEYAYGELVAELAACFLCQARAMPDHLENHKNYIASWGREMKNNVGYIWKASRDASKIADDFLKQAGIKTEEQNDTEE
jgi:antirestriction protein ArdC